MNEANARANRAKAELDAHLAAGWPGIDNLEINLVVRAQESREHHSGNQCRW